MKKILLLALALILGATQACAQGDLSGEEGGGGVPPATYNFPFVTCETSTQLSNESVLTAGDGVVIDCEGGQATISASETSSVTGFWTGKDELCATSEKVSDTSLTCTLTEPAETGNVIIITAATNNLSTSGSSNDLSVDDDDTGNTITKAIEVTNPGTAGETVTVAIWYGVVSEHMAVGDTITLTLSGATAAKAMNVTEFYPGGASAQLVLDGSTSVATDASTDPTSYSISGLTEADRLWVHVHGIETGDGDAYVDDQNYAALAPVGTTGTGFADNVSLRGGQASARSTSNSVDVGATVNTTDHAQALIALRALVLPIGTARVVADPPDPDPDPDPPDPPAELDPPAPTGAVFYISPNGSGTACTSSNPCSLATAEDQVTIHGAIYFKAGNYNGGLDIGRSGTSVGYITYSAAPGDEHEAIIEGTVGSTNDCVRAINRSFIVITGLRIPGRCGRAGVAVGGNNSVSEGVWLHNLLIRDTGQSCIGLAGSWPFSNSFPASPRATDWFIVRNDVAECNQNGQGQCDAGGQTGIQRNEQISVGNHATDGVIAFNRVGGPCQYGIDLKKGARNIDVHHNEIYDIEKHCFYVDTADHFAEDIDFHHNSCVDSRNGVTLAREWSSAGLPQTLSNIRIWNNLFINTGRYCYRIDRHQGDNLSGTADGFLFANNTCYRTGKSSSYNDAGIMVTLPDATDVVIRNNVVWDSDHSPCVFNNNEGVTQSNNNCEATNPNWTAPNTGDFSFGTGSVLFDGGTSTGLSFITDDYDGDDRPACSAFDIGHIERQSC